jgi:hypothetical protein
MESDDVSCWTTIFRDLLNEFNRRNTALLAKPLMKYKKEDIDKVMKYIKKRGRVKKYEDLNEGDSVRLQLQEKTFRK